MPFFREGARKCHLPNSILTQNLLAATRSAAGACHPAQKQRTPRISPETISAACERESELQLRTGWHWPSPHMNHLFPHGLTRWFLRAFVAILFDGAWRTSGEAMAAVERTKELWCEADMHRIAGEIAPISRKANRGKADPYFRRLLALARQQRAKVLGRQTRSYSPCFCF